MYRIEHMIPSKSDILNLLEVNDKAVIRALVVINNNQTAIEKSVKNSVLLNNMGFRPNHAKMGTEMVDFYKRHGYLTPNQIRWWRVRTKNGKSRIGIYWRQLQESAKSRIGE